MIVGFNFVSQKYIPHFTSKSSSVYNVYLWYEQKFESLNINRKLNLQITFKFLKLDNGYSQSKQDTVQGKILEWENFGEWQAIPQNFPCQYF